MTGDIWIVLIEDRHSDVEARPFSTEEAAVRAAVDAAPTGTSAGELNSGMRSDGWVLHLPYGPEGDMVRVVKRVLDRG